MLRQVFFSMEMENAFLLERCGITAASEQSHCGIDRRKSTEMGYQNAVVDSRLAGEEGKHDAEVGVLQLQPKGAAHLPPQRGLLIGVARQSHGHHVQVEVAW